MSVMVGSVGNTSSISSLNLAIKQNLTPPVYLVDSHFDRLILIWDFLQKEGKTETSNQSLPRIEPSFITTSKQSLYVPYLWLVKNKVQ